MHVYRQKIDTYRCPKCGVVVSRNTVRDAPDNALFACDCGWEGDSRGLHRAEKIVVGRDALRVVEPATGSVH